MDMRFEGRWSIGEDKEGVKNLWSINKPNVPNVVDRFCARDVGVRYFGDRYAIKLTKEAAEAIKLMHGNHLWKNVFYDALNNRWLINVTFVNGGCTADYKALAHSTDTVDCELRLYSDGKVTCEVTDVFKDLDGGDKLKASQDTGRNENRKFVDYSACSKLNKEDKKMRNRVMGTDFRIKNVIFNPPATIVMWGDGTKTVVKCQEGDTFDPEKGIAMCVMKRLYGTNPSGSNYLKVSNRYVKGFKKTSSDAVAVTDISEKALKVRDAMMTGGATKWELDTFDRFCRKYLDRK